MTEQIISFDLQLDEVQLFFKNFTLLQLEQYNAHMHGRTIIGSVEHNYLSVLQKVVREQKYTLDEAERNFVFSDGKLFYKDDVSGYDLFTPCDMREKVLRELDCSLFVSPEALDSLREESGLVFGVLSTFKKLNWALKLRFGQEAPNLRKSVEERVLELYNSTVTLSSFHQSERVVAFIINYEGLNMSESNYRRNMLYSFMEKVLGR